MLCGRDAYLQHEWVAEVLGEMGDPRAIPALRAACSFEVAGDAFRSLPKRCLEALIAISTPEAVAAAREQLASPWPEVREWAAEVLVESDAPDQV
ncbi:PBS lyase HEAT-like repeat protein [Gemmata sp. SH-PL17]|uniref:HEAT repeat domain-containing protein n=1 Tax=Gemmata sp. SH-PL17 TaxID=1630693 RepID=UPI00078DE3C5|nr:HEAT repeat domain-containing protein [Gemmata sp. SH-PL17]AMV26081.1 PBS lyase HEAT-like repeat protein [Gemmata sp. SH-PL17]